MKSLFLFGLGFVSGLGLSRYFFRKDRKGKGYQEKIYTIARRVPLIVDNGMILEYGISDEGEMFRILDGKENVVVSSGKILFYHQTENDFTIKFSNGYVIQADEDTIFVINTENDIVYESSINYEDIHLKKISMNSPVFDKFHDFIQSKV
jgi:hypothetical protein